MISVLRSRARRSGDVKVLLFVDRLDPARFELLFLELFDDRERELREDVEVFLFVTELPPRGAIIAYDDFPSSPITL
jgi:hypothetical protein